MPELRAHERNFPESYGHSKCSCTPPPGRPSESYPTRTQTTAAIDLGEAFCEVNEAPGVGLEPTTYGLTVRRSAN
jgi:hypothetical protein